MNIRAALPLLAAALASAQKVEFNRDVRPILSDRCYTCHGPDEGNRKSKVRFDLESSARPALDEMLRRVASENKALRMPPVFAGPALPPRDIETLRRWVDQGAPWEKHWSLIAPKRPAVPSLAAHPVDAFILERLQREGLAPGPPAAKGALLRRLSFDLTGLPPSPAELDAFLADSSPDAYSKAVDRLLASPRYGERMAYKWLDAARYADTNGYQTDAERFMWRWRDWVIEAYNSNMPFDRFTVEQLAGDLLPQPSLDQLIATGFNRNHRGNGEGGIVPEEYAVEYVIDRVETTSTVWLGLTAGCARCHDHKYDPVSQKEFYQLYAFFNSIPEKGKVFKYGNSPPMIPAPTRSQQEQLRALDAKVASAQSRFHALGEVAARAAKEWAAAAASSWTIRENLAVEHGAEEAFDGKRFADLGDKGRFDFYDKFTLAARIAPAADSGAILSRAELVSEGGGYGLYLVNGKLQANLVQRWLDDCLRVETERALETGREYHVAMTYDGSRVADGIRIYVNGEPQKLRYIVDDLNQPFNVKEPLRVGAGLEHRFLGRIGDVRVYSAALSQEEVAILAGTAPEAKKRRAFLEEHAPAEVREAWKQLAAARAERRRALDSFPTVMVMQELPEPRQAHILNRGSYERPGAPVSRAVPAALPPLPGGAPVDRLGLARWLVDPANPLTARVTVNRYWQMLFGAGLVRTAEDFGSQGEWPSHPELLDWLATEYIRTGWDTKALLKTIVTSDAYRRASEAQPAMLERDPENRLLARGPRFRLPAEMVRDQALFVSGLLVEKRGGPSVKPYQPRGLWSELSGGADYVADKGEGLWRRSLYTFWKRASPPPGMSAFDAAGRETCIVRDTRTNTPLQALTLMNDVQYLEAARKLAERAIREGGSAPLAWAFRAVLARDPSPEERGVLESSYQTYLDRFRTSPQAAAKYLQQGESPRDPALDPARLAAYAAVSSLILNLDEAVTKQ